MQILTDLTATREISIHREKVIFSSVMIIKFMLTYYFSFEKFSLIYFGTVVGQFQGMKYINITFYHSYIYFYMVPFLSALGTILSEQILR